MKNDGPKRVQNTTPRVRGQLNDMKLPYPSGETLPELHKGVLTSKEALIKSECADWRADFSADEA